MAIPAQLIADVGTLTNRADLADLIKLSIRNAVATLHSSGEFDYDIVLLTVFLAPLPAGITGTVGSPVSVLNITEETLVGFTRVRKLVGLTLDGMITVQKVPSHNASSAELQKIPFWVKQTAYTYIAIIHTTTVPIKLDLIYLINPDTSEAGFSSWIATKYPQMVVVEAAAQLFKAIGKDDEYQRFAMQSMMNIQSLRASHMDAEGNIEPIQGDNSVSQAASLLAQQGGGQ